MTEVTHRPPSGLWQPTQLQQLYYGSSIVSKHLLSTLPSDSSKAYIITTNSLATKTPLINQIESLLNPSEQNKKSHSHYGGTISTISQHAPIAALDAATQEISHDASIDTLISVGGGSPIDAAKALSSRYNEKHGRYLHHIAIPTTLSAAECTATAGYTNAEGVKVLTGGPECVPHAILYDAEFARHTPPKLWLSTGIRALDHAVELMVHPTFTEVPGRQMALFAAGALFKYLPRYKQESQFEGGEGSQGDGSRASDDTITQLQLAAFASLGYFGLNTKGGIGLSHSLGYALGAPYGIPHGITSCLTLARVVQLKAGLSDEDAEQFSRVLPLINVASSDDGDAIAGEPRRETNREDALRLGKAIVELVRKLGLETNMKEWGVGDDQVDIIAQRATKQESGELYDKVRELVKGLW